MKSRGARCPYCGRTVAVKANGVFRRHSDRGRLATCTGSGRPPRLVPPK